MPYLQSLLVRAVVVIVAIVAAYGAGYWQASASVAEITALKGRLESAQTNLTQAQRAQDDAELKLAAMQAEKLDLQESINDLTDDVAARHGRDACRLTDDDTRRLLNIR